MPAVAAILPDGKRLHLQHGPIDLIIAADGAPDAVRTAYSAAARRFAPLLDELVAELAMLRCEVEEPFLPRSFEPPSSTLPLRSSSRGLSPGPKSSACLGPGNKPRDDGDRDMLLSAHTLVDSTYAVKNSGFTPTPDPSPQGGGGRQPLSSGNATVDEAEDHCEAGTAAAFPSPLRGGACPRRRDQQRIGPVPRGMVAPVPPTCRGGGTPMAAVAGAVADEILAAMLSAAPLARVHVNNGGDIALHLESGETLTVAGPAGTIRIDAASPVRGVATSGWRGRSFSLGIADAVTVLAKTAAAADAAATLIANRVDLPGSAKITRQPARDLAPDSDLRDRPVTTGVGPLDAQEIARALDAGEFFAGEMLRSGHILGAALLLSGETRMAVAGLALSRKGQDRGDRTHE